MASSIAVPAVDGDNGIVSSTEALDASGSQFNESELIQPPTNSGELFTDGGSLHNATLFDSERYLLCEKFVIVEIVMTTLELFISVLAATLMPRWRKNYRSQMLMQLTLARFLKRLTLIIKFLLEYDKIPATGYVPTILTGCQFYIDFVIVILVFYFIKHMYNSLIIVIVKISQNSLYKVLMCSWLIPVPISALCTTLIVTKVMNKWLVYLLMCGMFRWPLIFVGTGLYITIVYRVLADKIRQFASSLAIVTFLLCLIINIHLFSKDIIELCWIRSFSTELTGYVSGLLLNLLILSLYAVLIILSFTNKSQSSRSDIPDYSLAEVPDLCVVKCNM